MFGYFLDVNHCKFNVLHNPSSSQHYDRPHYSFRCDIESKHYTRMYCFKGLHTWVSRCPQTNSPMVHVYKGCIKYKQAGVHKFAPITVAADSADHVWAFSCSSIS